MQGFWVDYPTVKTVGSLALIFMDLDNAVYGFVIYNNPNAKNSTTYLLFRGIGVINDGKFKRIKKYDYLTSSYGFKKLRTYYDMVLKFGAKPCILLDVENNVVSPKQYLSQDEIASKHQIKVSRLSSKPFSEKDTTNKKM